jgi:hypothetical protein
MRAVSVFDLAAMQLLMSPFRGPRAFAFQVDQEPGTNWMSFHTDLFKRLN